MLTSIRLKNFKSFADQTVELSPLTLLVGESASGKSNFLDALRFLQGIGLGLPLSDVFRGRVESGHGVWPGLRGGAQGVTRKGAKSFTIESRWSIGKDELTHKITCSVDPEPIVEHESLEAKTAGGPLFDTRTSTRKGFEGLASGGAMKASPKKSLGARGGAADKVPARRSLLGQIEHQRGRAEDVSLGDVVALCHALQSAMKSALALDIDPSQMKGYVAHEIDHVGAHGQHLSAVLKRACQEHDHKSDVLGWLRALSAAEIADIEFVETELGDVMMVVVEKDGTRVPAPCLPDGVLRVLGTMVGVLAAPEGSVILVEELERGLHPERAGLLVKTLETATRPGASQVLATTHAPWLLAALPPQALGQAVVFGRDPATAETVARRLASLPRLEEIAARDPGQLLSFKALAAQ